MAFAYNQALAKKQKDLNENNEKFSSVPLARGDSNNQDFDRNRGYSVYGIMPQPVTCSQCGHQGISV